MSQEERERKEKLRQINIAFRAKLAEIVPQLEQTNNWLVTVAQRLPPSREGDSQSLPRTNRQLEETGKKAKEAETNLIEDSEEEKKQAEGIEREEAKTRKKDEKKVEHSLKRTKKDTEITLRSLKAEFLAVREEADKWKEGARNLEQALKFLNSGDVDNFIMEIHKERENIEKIKGLFNQITRGHTFFTRRHTNKEKKELDKIEKIIKKVQDNKELEKEPEYQKIVVLNELINDIRDRQFHALITDEERHNYLANDISKDIKAYNQAYRKLPTKRRKLVADGGTTPSEEEVSKWKENTVKLMEIHKKIVDELIEQRNVITAIIQVDTLMEKTLEEAKDII